MRIASPMSPPRPAAEVAVHDAFVTGAAISAWRISWKPPRPISQVAAWPESRTMGDSAASAVNSAPTALAWPGPPVTMAMPGSPVSRPHASAICTAAASWRTCTRSSFVSSAASKSDIMWLPDSVNTCRHSRRSSERATMSAPRSGLVMVRFQFRRARTLARASRRPQGIYSRPAARIKEAAVAPHICDPQRRFVSSFICMDDQDVLALLWPLRCATPPDVCHLGFPPFAQVASIRAP